MPTDEHPFDRVGAALEARGAIRRRSVDQIRAACPTHSDARPSLVVTRRPDRALVHCFAGCRQAQILRALQLRPSDLFVGPRPQRERVAIVEAYDYLDRGGVLIARKVRTASKQFWWRHPDPSARGGWRNGLGGAGLPCLYRRPELVGADVVFVVEGEKAVDRLRSLGLVATCGAAGASAWKGSGDLLDAVLPNATIAILPDHDRPGERHAEQVAADLDAHRGDTAIVVKVLPLPALPPGGDVFDWLETGGTRDALLAFVAATPVWLPGAASERRRKHRAFLAKKRKQREREEARKVRAMIVAPGDVQHGAARHANAVAAALRSVLAELERDGIPRSGRQLKAALAGKHARDVVDDALKAGREPGGALAYEPGRRGAMLYRVRILERLPDIHHVTDHAGHSASVRMSQTEPDTQLSVCTEQNSVSECPVTRSRVTQGERSSCTLQENIPPVHTCVTLSPDTQVSDTHFQDTEFPDTKERDTRPDTDRQDAIAEGRCCGKNGVELRCKLCRWSPTYSPALRMLRESGWDHFDVRGSR